MNLAVVHSRSLLAMAAPEVAVEVHLSGGLPAFHIVGLPQTEVRESRDRVRAAIQHLGFEFPNRKITVNLAPADLPKESGRFDLPIALGILCASGQLTSAPLARHEAVGELSLTGELRPIRGAVAMALAVRRQSEHRTLLLPRANATDAALIRGVGFAGIGSLADAARLFEEDEQKLPEAVREHRLAIIGPADIAMSRGDPPGRHARPARRQAVAARPSAAGGASGSNGAEGPDLRQGPDLADVHGHQLPKRALEVAAAGEHSLLMLRLSNPKSGFRQSSRGTGVISPDNVRGRASKFRSIFDPQRAPIRHRGSKRATLATQDVVVGTPKLSLRASPGVATLLPSFCPSGDCV